MKKIDVKEFWKKHKKKIIIIGSSIGSAATVYVLVKHVGGGKKDILNLNMPLQPFQNGILSKRAKIEIPEMDGMICLDIAKDINDGRIVWLDGSQVKLMGKVGENLCKIDGVNPDMLATMIILEKE